MPLTTLLHTMPASQTVTMRTTEHHAMNVNFSIAIVVFPVAVLDLRPFFDTNTPLSPETTPLSLLADRSITMQASVVFAIGVNTLLLMTDKAFAAISIALTGRSLPDTSLFKTALSLFAIFVCHAPARSTILIDQTVTIVVFPVSTTLRRWQDFAFAGRPEEINTRLHTGLARTCKHSFGRTGKTGFFLTGNAGFRRATFVYFPITIVVPSVMTTFLFADSFALTL